jgi:hypothetical protein
VAVSFVGGGIPGENGPKFKIVCDVENIIKQYFLYNHD